MVGTPIAGWSIMENHIKVDDLGVPPFQETTIYVCVSVVSLYPLYQLLAVKHPRYVSRFSCGSITHV